MLRAIERVSSLYEALLRTLAVLACVLLFLMMCIICADVLLRNVPLIPSIDGLPWSDEVSESSLYVMTLLAAPWLLRQSQHIRVDILLRALPERIAWYCEWLADLLALICCVTITYYGLSATIVSYRAGYMTIKTLITPEWWHLCVIPAAFLLLSIEMLFRMRRLYLIPQKARTETVPAG